MEAAVLFIVFAILLFMGTPIAVCLGVSSIAAMLVMLAGRPVDITLGTVPQLVSAATSKAVLQAIPFFILGGNIMDASGISRKLIHLVRPASATCAAASRRSASSSPASSPPSPAPARPRSRPSA